MAKDWERLIECIKKNRNFILAAHENPDGDALGSVLALRLILEKMGKKVEVAIDPAAVPSKYDFLPGVNRLKSKVNLQTPFVFVALECGSQSRLGVTQNLVDKASIFVNIDHHPDNDNFGDINVVNPESAAVCALIFQLANRLRIDLDYSIALCLYVGVITDTGRFQYSNTTPQILQIAKELLTYGLDPYQIFRKIFENQTLNSVKLFSLVIDRLEFDEKSKVISSYLTRKDFDKIKIEYHETENYIDFLRAVKDVEAAVFLKEITEGTFRVGLRSTGRVNVGEIARLFQGGGHSLAAGFSSQEDREKIVATIRERVIADLKSPKD